MHFLISIFKKLSYKAKKAIKWKND